MSIREEILILLESLLIPIVNENDVVSDEELCKYRRGIGENDQLARMIAELVRARRILFLTSVGGVYEENPLRNSNTKIFSALDISMVEQLNLFGVSGKGVGGMEAKVKEALLCSEQGMRTVIAGLAEDSILRFGRDEHVGTRIE